ncbi:hypothetical protein DER45DRAFT_580574 [Fusarium avenaceum]|uniref:WGS project CBMG000000000 data, contig CS5907-c003779 n=1 Tax=Fusarium acuminatum CS5907 TaxID=1318461 RepID=A0A090MGD2_9HYPO|nr:hypothetical protein DER45DRAFT_580574 [Fusarium avenaceum]CEG03997.1 unnamed protein product [Fusarium acuminatum CS5907]
MCHTVIAQRMCKACRYTLGETVIDFTRCARKCSSPFYCLTPEPQMELCSLCTAAVPMSTSILAYDAKNTYTTTATAVGSAGTRLFNHPFTKAETYPLPEVTRLAASH